MKKIIILLLTMFSSVVSAYAQNFEVDGISYNVTKGSDGESPGEVEVIKSISNGTDDSGGYSGNIEISDEITYDNNTYKVTCISWSAFQNCPSLTSITIPNSVTTIHDRAFQNCTGLSSITIPNSVTWIGGYGTFSGCNKLTSVTLSDQLRTIEHETFENCPSLSSITIPSSVTEIGGNAFKDCSKLTTVIFGEDGQLKTIGGSAFENCTNLSSITIPNSVKTIDGPSFKGCSNLTTVIFGEDGQLKTIGGGAFENCTSLSSITIPNSVKTIDGSAFYGCSSLMLVKSEISTPFDVNAFYPATLLDAILIVPNGSRNAYKSVSGWGFALTFEEGETIPANRVLTDEQGIIYKMKQTDDNSLYYSVAGHSEEMNMEIVIPANLGGYPVRTIESFVFNGCTSLLSVTIPNSVTTIGARAFNNCSNLSTVKMGKNVSSIGECAFEYCTGLSSITLPTKLECIGNSAFAWCSITSIAIPGSVKTIGDEAFICCGELVSVSFEEGLTSIGVNAFRHCPLTSITIPNSVTTIGSGAFSEIGTLTTAILGDGITEINSALFEGGGSLTSVTIPDGVTSIGEKAFNRCHLTSVKLPESLTSMGADVFAYCPLKSIELPDAFTVIPANLFKTNDFEYVKLGNNVKSIGKNAFGCNLDDDETMIVLEIATSTPPQIASDAFPNIDLSDLNVIVPDAAAENNYRKAAVWKDMTFANLDNNAEVTVETPGELGIELILQCNMMPAKVVGLKVNGKINADDFMQMRSNMKSLLLLDLSGCTITEIPDEALMGKTQLRELTLPIGLQTIGRSAFQGCTYLTGKLNLPSTVTSIGDYAFEGTDYTSVSLPTRLQTIGAYAFYSLPLKQSLILPDGVTSIGDYAFADTHIDDDVEIPDGVTYLGEGAFRNTLIPYVSLPNSITSVSKNLFQGCSSLGRIYIPDNYTEVFDNAFDGCVALRTLRMSANLISMGEYAFQSIPREYIKVPSQVEVLPKGVFKNCKNLVSLSLPANLKSMEAEALNGCIALRNLSVEAIEPPVIKDKNAMRGINTDLCLISIPTQSYRAYVLAEYWGQFVQMRNDIAVETEGNGEIAFESVVEEEEEASESRSGSRGQRRTGTRAGTRASTDEDESLTVANNGSSIYIPQQGKVRFYIIPGKGEELLSATLDGKDITSSIVDGIYTATADKKNAKLVAKFSGTKLEVDANGDNKVNVADIVHLINAKASQADIDKVVKIVMGK